MNGCLARGVPYTRVETKCYGGIKMKMGTFLMGGIAGAAAVMYFNRKAKSMMFSGFSSSNASVGKSWKNQSKQQGKMNKQDSAMPPSGNGMYTNEEKSMDMH
jgi:hypothetical protein